MRKKYKEIIGIIDLRMKTYKNKQSWNILSQICILSQVNIFKIISQKSYPVGRWPVVE